MRLDCPSSSRVLLASAALLSAFLVVAGTAFGQDTGQASFATPLRAGARALQFQIAPDFTLSSFQGSTLSYKLQRSATSAFRLGVSISGSGTGADSDGSTTQWDTLRVERAGQTEQNAFSVAVAIQMLRFHGSASRVVPFFGFGPGASFSRSHRESRISSEQFVQDNGATSRQVQTWGQGLAGVEWFAGRQLSFHAEYGLRAGYMWQHESRTESHRANSNGTVLHTDQALKEDADGWFLRDGSVLFGLSVYF